MIISDHVIIPEKVKEDHGNWYCCPRCGTKIFRIKPYAKAEGIEIKCRRCKKIINVSL